MRLESGDVDADESSVRTELVQKFYEMKSLVRVLKWLGSIFHKITIKNSELINYWSSSSFLSPVTNTLHQYFHNKRI